jgi:hypothetical protein
MLLRVFIPSELLAVIVGAEAHTLVGVGGARLRGRNRQGLGVGVAVATTVATVGVGRTGETGGENESEGGSEKALHDHVPFGLWENSHKNIYAQDRPMVTFRNQKKCMNSQKKS